MSECEYVWERRDERGGRAPIPSRGFQTPVPGLEFRGMAALGYGGLLLGLGLATCPEAGPSGEARAWRRVKARSSARCRAAHPWRRYLVWKTVSALDTPIKSRMRILAT